MPVAGLILFEPGIKFKAIKADALNADADFGQVPPHLRIEAVPVHAEIARRIAETNDPGQEAGMDIAPARHALTL